MQRLHRPNPYPLHSVQATRAIELSAMGRLPPNTLMQRAGLAVAQLARAVAPHARVIWLACGPGNNGGDGLEAAVHLRAHGYEPVVTWLGSPTTVPPDAHAAWERAQQAGVVFAEHPPADFDVCIDALLGIGSTRVPQGRMAAWIEQMNLSGVPVLGVDVPTGLDADTGEHSAATVRAHHCLSLLTLKPGLFTAHGRDAAVQVWWDDLGVDCSAPTALLSGAPHPDMSRHLHSSHKGSRGDVAVVGGAPAMVGAALLAASGALHAGAGRVFVSLLGDPSITVDVEQPELMLRPFNELALDSSTVVAGCGGGSAIASVLPALLQKANHLVLDADALNAIAQDTSLQALLRQRGAPMPTVLTPHPLEAARLLTCSTAEVQGNRLQAAQQLADRFDCVVLLKGSGSITAAPATLPQINPTGNARLATGGTGDVLAGLIGARLAQGHSAHAAASAAAYQHGQLADTWPAHRALTASALACALNV